MSAHSRARRAAAALVSGLAIAIPVKHATAFPPYRSTDADTASPGTIELRAGFIKIERDRGNTDYTTPLMRLNFGLPEHLELVSEVEYAPENGRLGDAAIGMKWVPLRRGISLGAEALALLPVRENDDGAGFEGQLIVTVRDEEAILHVNAGGFHDARPASAESGWRSSMLVEAPLRRVRPGLELFAKQVTGKSVDVRAGTGAIVDLGGIDLRAGLHAGVTREAPDLVFSLWIGIRFGGP